MLFPSKNNFMIVAVAATIHEISEMGECFKWPVLSCEKCSCRLWGHGFVGRYFDGVADLVRIKRLICPDCGMVVSFRPMAFWPRFRSSIEEIYIALMRRLGSGFWPIGFKRQRGWYWLKKFMSSVLMSGHCDPAEFLKQRFSKAIHFFV